ncbi:uncharacterized protein LOC110691748 [Chenopodium quinoa]|uniref:uncharacterized protein LOC110691748 n=1 Tax=Chenopodium quinoa TaxID=63459 RepID=UPI000B76FC48|nr:uncharacterized protein LOC110691748 [Chenopodium quinoa]XP_021724381.1 uncharacterized protein LOC110691748 [Chenopodium quinoa]XP_021724382.1 uncharacterized protein LOC110691748 [Chenopodium quinoa]
MANLTKDTAGVSSVPTQRKIQLGKSTAQKKSEVHNQQEKEVEIGNSVQTKTGQSKTVVAPSSLSAYRQMQTQLLEKKRRAKQSDLLLRRKLRPINMASSLVHLGSSQAQSFSQPQRFRHDLQEYYENHMGANERNLEQYVDEEDEFSDDLSTLTPEELGMQDEPLMNQEHESEKIALPKRKRTRGPTMCKDVHEWTLEERKPIVLNEMGKPIGPDDKTVNTFTRFLGTLARNSSLAPLNKINWHYVPDKEQIWSYVKKKYIIADEGKNCVLSSVGRLWRRYKCSVKAAHFTPYDNDGDRLANPPNTIPEAHFKELLEFWNLEQVQVKLCCLFPLYYNCLFSSQNEMC